MSMPIWFWVLVTSPLWVSPVIACLLIITTVIGLLGGGIFFAIAFPVAYIRDMITKGYGKIVARLKNMRS